MIDADAFAVLIADWCLDVQAGQQILIKTTTLAEEPAAALLRAILDRGAWPLIRLETRDLASDFFRHAREEHLDAVPSLELHEAETVDASIRINAPASMHPLAGADPASVSRRACGPQEPLTEALAAALVADDLADAGPGRRGKHGIRRLHGLRGARAVPRSA